MYISPSAFGKLNSRFFKSIQTYFNVHMHPWVSLKLNVMDSFPALVFGIFSIRCCWMGRYIAIYCKGRRFFEKLDYCKYTVSQLFSFLWMWIDEHMQGQLYPFSIHKEIFISIKMGFLVMLVVVVREMKWCVM